MKTRIVLISLLTGGLLGLYSAAYAEPALNYDCSFLKLVGTGPFDPNEPIGEELFIVDAEVRASKTGSDKYKHVVTAVKNSRHYEATETTTISNVETIKRKNGKRVINLRKLQFLLKLIGPFRNSEEISAQFRERRGNVYPEESCNSCAIILDGTCRKTRIK